MNISAIAKFMPQGVRMPRFIRDSLRARILTGISIMLLPLLGLVAVALLGINSVNGSFKEVMEEVIEEMEPVMHLQIAVLQAAMPANDYLIHGDRSERDEFARLSGKVEGAFGQLLEPGPFHLEEERALLASAHKEWRQAQSISETLLALPRPVGDAAAASDMKRMDAHVDRVVGLFGQLHELADKEIKKEFAAATATGRTVLRVVFGVFAVGFAVALSVSAALAWSILTRVKALSEGARAFGDGNFSYRVQLEEPDELGQLARRFNAMAEALEKSRATIEQRASQLDAINQTAVAINSSLQLKDILDEIMRRGIALTGAGASCIAFYDEAAGRFKNWVTQGLSEHFVQNMNFRPGGLADEAFTTAGFVLSNDRPDTPHKLSKLTHEEGLKSFVCMPLTSGERRLGVIYFYRVDRDTFTPTEIELLHTFASLAAQAIENARLYAQTLEQATTDPLTGVSNRLKFNRELAVEIARSARYKTPLALVMYDIDHFKAVNDTHGHQVGDRVLVDISRIIAGHVRQTDLLARWGGEEFMILAANCGAQQADRLAEKLRRLINEAAFDEVGTMTCSFGVAQFQDGDTAETLASRADEALYAAKRAGRNRVCSLGPEQSMEKRQ